jgi:hypothetical protein
MDAPLIAGVVVLALAPLGPYQHAAGFGALHEDPVDVIVCRYREGAGLRYI